VDTLRLKEQVAKLRGLAFNYSIAVGPHLTKALHDVADSIERLLWQDDRERQPWLSPNAEQAEGVILDSLCEKLIEAKNELRRSVDGPRLWAHADLYAHAVDAIKRQRRQTLGMRRDLDHAEKELRRVLETFKAPFVKGAPGKQDGVRVGSLVRYVSRDMNNVLGGGPVCGHEKMLAIVTAVSPGSSVVDLTVFPSRRASFPVQNICWAPGGMGAPMTWHFEGEE